MSTQRGVIKNVKRAQQLNNFKDLIRKRNITPTDIDGLIDYGGKFFVYLEGKKVGKETDSGQRHALEAVINSHWKASNPSMAIIYEHDIPVEEQIPVAFMFVRGIYSMRQIPCLCGRTYNGSNWWFPQSDTIRVLDAIEHFENHFNVWI